jgi:hypothetical protein
MGLAPYLPAHRPRATPRWWIARTHKDGTITLEESATLPAPEQPCGIAAPTSLPQPFLDYLEEAHKPLAGLKLNRLLKLAREFAGRQQRGKRHPARSEEESLSALDRRRLPLFFAAQPLLHTEPTEVDVPAYLRQRDLPHAHLADNTPEAIDNRARILDALDVRIADRDYAIASYDALRAVIALVAGARA